MPAVPRVASPGQSLVAQLSLTAQDVICTSADCPIFYRRTARQKEVATAVAQLDRFSTEQMW
jgi:hypothetical protein